MYQVLRESTIAISLIKYRPLSCVCVKQQRRNYYQYQLSLQLFTDIFVVVIVLGVVCGRLLPSFLHCVTRGIFHWPITTWISAKPIKTRISYHACQSIIPYTSPHKLFYCKACDFMIGYRCVCFVYLINKKERNIAKYCWINSVGADDDAHTKSHSLSQSSISSE